MWPLLWYMPATTVRIERMRWEYDCIVEGGANDGQLEGEKAKLAGLLEAQLADALSRVPDSGLAGSF